MTLVAPPIADPRAADEATSASRPDPTRLADGTSAAVPPRSASPGAARRATLRSAAAEPDRPTPKAVAATVAGWLGVLALAIVAVAYPLGPLFQRREQHRELASFRVEVQQAADSQEGLAGLLDRAVPQAPAPGDAVAILDLGRLRIQQVAVEGVDPAQTRIGPGHVPGTAGLGQPGNAVVVGRRATAGGPFAELDRLRAGDQIVATTTQGQSVYVVTSNRTRAPDDDVYGPSDDDRLTLVTSARRRPWARDRATVVVAQLDGRPFEPTAQGARAGTADGRHGDDAAIPSLALFALAYAGTAALAAVLYRRWRPLTAYLLTTPALVVFAILSAEAALRLLPAWA